MNNVRRRIRVAAVSIAIAVPALLSVAPAGAAPVADSTVYYPVVPTCIPAAVPQPTGSSVHPCTPYWLMSVLQVMSMGSTEGTGSAGSSTGS